MKMKSVRWLIVSGGMLVAPAPLLAQFGTPGSTNVREKIVGRLLSAEGAPTVAASDQLGAFFNNQLVGAVTFTGTDNQFSLTIYGDVPTTTQVEGPRAGQAVQFRFFDASANATRTDVRVENLEGEAFNYRYAGELNAFPDGLPIPIDLTPVRELNMRVGVTSGGGGGGGGGGADRDKYDVDGNDRIDEADAAMVLRLVIGGGRGLSESEVEAADVNGDSAVNTLDAIEIMRNRP